MAKKIIFVSLMMMLVGCGVLFPAAPPRFPQFAEHSIAGPGSYEIPQWGPDSRYLAFVASSRDETLVVYDTESQTTWTVATNIYSAHFSWTPSGDLTYLKYRPELSGSPYPIILDLHQVDRNGTNDVVIATELSSAGDFDWFSDGKRIAILLTEPTSRSSFNDVYLLDTVTDTTDLLLKAENVALQYIASLALSPDEKSILVYGIREESGQTEVEIVVYDLENQAIHDRFQPSQVIPPSGISYPPSGLGDSTNFDWVGGQRWFLANTITPGGDCYNYALFFFDMYDLQNSFCIVAIGGIFAAPTISPDLSKISYVTVAGVGQDYLMIGDVPPDLLTKLDLKRVGLTQLSGANKGFKPLAQGRNAFKCVTPKENKVFSAAAAAATNSQVCFCRDKTLRQHVRGYEGNRAGRSGRKNAL